MNAKEMNSSDLAALIGKVVVGQDAAVHAVAGALAANGRRQRLLDAGHPAKKLPSRASIMLVGPSGCGKTLLVTTAAEVVNVPHLFTECPRYSAAGYKGEDVGNIFRDLLAMAGNDLALAQRGMVFLDEADKIKKRRFEGDVGGVAVQHALLGPLHGAVIPVPRAGGGTALFDTSNITFISAGVFEGIGDKDGPDVIASEQLENFGLIREFVGRFSGFVRIHPFTVERLANVLREGESSELAKTRYLLAVHRIELVAGDEALRTAAEIALARGTGVRGLNSVVGDVCIRIQNDLDKLVGDGVAKVILDPATFREGKPPVYKKGPRTVTPPVPLKPPNETPRPKPSEPALPSLPRRELPTPREPNTTPPTDTPKSPAAPLPACRADAFSPPPGGWGRFLRAGWKLLDSVELPWSGLLVVVLITLVFGCVLLSCPYLVGVPPPTAPNAQGAPPGSGAKEGRRLGDYPQGKRGPLLPGLDPKE